jgi:hypothetical protein
MSGLSSLAQGLSVPNLETIAQYHPQFALAILAGVPCRPDIRSLSVDFDSSAAIGNYEPASFSEIISSYSIFGGSDITIDPTSAFAGNPLKYLNDVGQALVSGITVTLLVKGRGADYSPVADETPLQSAPRLLSASVGVWNLDNPDNVKARFTLQSFPNGSAGPSFPFTIWWNFAFWVLAAEGAHYMCLDPREARRRLRDEWGLCIGRCGPANNANPTPSVA